MLNPADIEKLAKIVELGSFAHAAEFLGVTQPALSKSIAKLERNLNVRLLERRARGVLPTAFAEVLLRRTQPALAELRAAMLEVETLRQGVKNHVAVGLAPAVAHCLLPQLAAALQEQKEQLCVGVRQGLSDELLARVRNGELDFAITTEPQQELWTDLRTRLLYQDRFLPFGPASHPLVQAGQPVAHQALLGLPWVLAQRDGLLRKRFNACFAQQGSLAPEPLIEVGSITISKQLIERQGFFSFLPTSVVQSQGLQQSIGQVPVPWLYWDRRISLIERQSYRPSQAQRWVAQLFIQAAAGLASLGDWGAAGV